MAAGGGIVVRLQHFKFVTVTCGWFLLVQELNDKPPGCVSVQGCD